MIHNHKKSLLYNGTGQDYWCKKCGKLWEDVEVERQLRIKYIIIAIICFTLSFAFGHIKISVAEAVTLHVDNSTIRNIQIVATVPLTNQNFHTTQALFDDPIEFYSFIETL